MAFKAAMRDFPPRLPTMKYAALNGPDGSVLRPVHARYTPACASVSATPSRVAMAARHASHDGSRNVASAAITRSADGRSRVGSLADGGAGADGGDESKGRRSRARGPR